MLDAQELACRSGHFGMEDLVTSSTAVLCGIHRDVRVPNQFFAVSRARIEDDADARPERDVAACDDDGFGHAVEQPKRKCNNFGLRDVFEQERELIAAEAGDGIALSDDALEPLRNLAQQPIAGVVPEAVVDLLEPVEVDEEDRDELAG